MLDSFNKHAKLSTRKRIDGMSDGAVVFLRRYLKEYIEMYKNVERTTFINYLANKTLARSTKALIAIGLGKFFLWEKLIDETDYKTILKSFRMPQKDWSNVNLSNEEVEQAIKLAGYGANSFVRRRNQLMFFLLSTLGLRVGQLINLTIDDIKKCDDFVAYKITKQKHVAHDIAVEYDVKRLPLNYNIGKYFHDELFNAYISVRDNYSPFFYNRRGDKLTSRYIQKIANKIGKQIGVELSPHKFRHYVGSTIANKPNGLLKANLLLGHSDLRTTMKYINKNIINIFED